MMNEKFFIVKYLPKKNGFRKIVTYRSDNSIRENHEKIKGFVVANSLPSKYSKAYIKKRSIVTNAKAHMYNDVFLMIDIKRFFANISHRKLVDFLYFELNKKKNIISKMECEELVASCSVGEKGLPIGFVTSPVLSNLYLKEFDNIFYGRLKKYELNNTIYTRYADDLTISFKKDNIPTENIIREIKIMASDLLKRYSLKLNHKKDKTIYLDKSNHVRVTGINIIKTEEGYRRLSVGKKRKNELFWNAIEYLLTDKSQRDITKLQQIKGMQSFILSVEKIGYEDVFSDGMRAKLNELGYDSLKKLIDELD